MKQQPIWAAECRGGPLDGERFPIIDDVPGYAVEVVVRDAWEYEVSFVWQGEAP